MCIGFIDYNEKGAEYQQRVMDAGAEKVLAEINKQLEEWRAAKS